MSLLKANGVQIGQSGTATQNFTLSVPTSPDGTITLARGNSGATTQDILSVDTSGFLNLVQTPVQFDDTTKLASTEFVRRALGNYRSMTSLDGTITAAHIGTILQPTTNTSVITFPTPTSINAPMGSSVTIWAGARTSSSIAAGVGSSFSADTTGYTSLPIARGQTIRVIAVSPTDWIVEDYTQKDNNFLAVLASSGYQKLPSGVIIQWGNIGTSATAGVTLTYPIAFPTVAGKLGFQVGSNAIAIVATTETTATPLSTVLVHGWRCDNNARIAASVNWIAIGY